MYAVPERWLIHFVVVCLYIGPRLKILSLIYMLLIWECVHSDWISLCVIVFMFSEWHRAGKFWRLCTGTSTERAVDLRVETSVWRTVLTTVFYIIKAFFCVLDHSIRRNIDSDLVFLDLCASAGRQVIVDEVSTSASRRFDTTDHSIDLISWT